ncbi:MAG TPA: MFS transporter [Gaiellaceae bacterium]|nr:MFS transporter [Gaiellaceae bacterium]
MVLQSSRRLGLVRRSRSFRLLFLATAGSSFGTYLAAIALAVDVYDLTGSGAWVAGLLIADFLPIVLIGLLLGPLVDRLSRRRLMIASDLVRLGVFAALPFVNTAAGIVALAGVAGIATGFFRPAVFAGLPNLVPDEELTNANSLLQTIDNVAQVAGPALGGILVAAWGPSVPYGINAVTFLMSAFLVTGIAERELRSEEPLTHGYWRDVADGVKLVFTSRPLRTVLVVWNVVILGAAAINVAEIFFARETLGAGDVGFGAIVAASGAGLVVGSYIAAPSLGKVGLRRHYVGSILLMGLGWGAAALTHSIWIAVPFVVGGAIGNGAAVICNILLVQRGAPDRFRGRAFATIMNTNYGVLGLAMACAGVLTDVYGARAVWLGGAVLYLVGALTALVLTRWLPVITGDQDEVMNAYANAAATALENGAGPTDPDLRPGPEPEPALASAPVVVAAPDGSAKTGLERIATLLEEIEERREVEARKAT